MSDGMCLRCHFNVPYAPGEDFCIDCAGDVENEIEQLKALRERSGPRPQGPLTSGNPSVRPLRSPSASDLESKE